MSTKQLTRMAFFFLMALLVTACSGAQQSITPTYSAEPTPTTINLEAATETPIGPGAPPATESGMLVDDDLVHLWARSGVLSPLEIPDIATGSPDSTPGCGNPQLTSFEESGNEIYLTLDYEQALIPASINLVMRELTNGITRVEILNTSTGLGREIFNENTSRVSTILANNDCTMSVVLPVDIDFAVNTVIIGFSDLAAAALLDAVELVGSPVTYEEPLVYWRVPLPGIPVSLTIDPLNQVYVSTASNELLKYDIEGNLLEEFTAPTNGSITDLAIDAGGNLVLSDGDFGEYIILSPDGEKTRGGGDAPTMQVAVGPGQENVYMLGNLGGLYYLLSYVPGSYEIINPLPLDGTSYAGLAFNADNKLYTMRDEDGFLVEIDHLSGLEVNSIPLKEYDQRGVMPQDLAIDRDGNFYVLFTTSADNTAIRVYDPSGFYMRSFGVLIDQPQDTSPEGSYFLPKGIALSPDARFALVIDGDGENCYLTCLLLRTD